MSGSTLGIYLALGLALDGLGPSAFCATYRGIELLNLRSLQTCCTDSRYFRSRSRAASRNSFVNCLRFSAIDFLQTLFKFIEPFNQISGEFTRPVSFALRVQSPVRLRRWRVAAAGRPSTSSPSSQDLATRVPSRLRLLKAVEGATGCLRSPANCRSVSEDNLRADFAPIGERLQFEKAGSPGRAPGSIGETRAQFPG